MHHTKKAFSFPEVLLTIAILASVILYFILSFTVSKYATQLSKSRLIVINLLREEMEKALNSAYVSIDSLAGTETIVINDGSKPMTITKTFSVSTEDPALYGYKKVYVNMAWTGGMSRNQPLQEEAVLYITKE